jgi:hypothetical protein
MQEHRDNQFRHVARTARLGRWMLPPATTDEDSDRAFLGRERPALLDLSDEVGGCVRNNLRARRPEPGLHIWPVEFHEAMIQNLK